MGILLARTSVGGLGALLALHQEWQREGTMQLHPGDLGWHWRFGEDSVAAAVRVWSRDGEVLALGFLDEPSVLRLALAPATQQDAELAHRLAEDIASPTSGVLSKGKVALEVTRSALVHALLVERGWVPDEPWTQLRLDLSQPLPSPDLRVEVVDAGRVADRTDVQRSAFEKSTFTDERWHVMAAGPLYADARCLVGYDQQDRPVAAVTVWSAGAGRPGLLEPLGVHRDHRGQGWGRAISLAAGAALQDLGASSALVCTPSANVGAVATYLAAGFEQLAEVRDLAHAL